MVFEVEANKAFAMEGTRGAATTTPSLQGSRDGRARGSRNLATPVESCLTATGEGDEGWFLGDRWDIYLFFYSQPIPHFTHSSFQPGAG